MGDKGPSLIARLRGWLAGMAFLLAGRLDATYAVWLDDAPRRDSDEPRSGYSGMDGKWHPWSDPIGPTLRERD